MAGLTKSPRKRQPKMPKHDFVRELAYRLDVSRETAVEVIETIQSLIIDSLHRYDEVKFGELVRFENVQQKSATRILRGQEVKTKPYVKVKATITERYRKHDEDFK